MECSTSPFSFFLLLRFKEHTARLCSHLKYMQDLCHTLHILHNIAAYIRFYTQKNFFIDSNNKQKKEYLSIYMQ